MNHGIDNLELAESTAIGDALSAGTKLLVNSADPNSDVAAGRDGAAQRR